jgi:hypothetical protein
MHGNISRQQIAAIKATPAVGNVTPACESEDWFYPAAMQLLGKDAGLQLHYITGYPQSSCYAYVAHNPDSRRKVPEHFLRVLFASSEGEPFFLAFMQSNKSTWWGEYRRAIVLKRAIDSVEGK